MLLLSSPKCEITSTANVNFVLGTDGARPWRQLDRVWILNMCDLVPNIRTSMVYRLIEFIIMYRICFSIPLIIVVVIWKPWRIREAIRSSAAAVVTQEMNRRHTMRGSLWSAWHRCVRLRILAMFTLLFGCMVPGFECCCHTIVKHCWSHARTHLRDHRKQCHSQDNKMSYCYELGILMTILTWVTRA